MSAQPQLRLTPEQYLEIERAAEFKSEYYNGRMYAMSGASYKHVIITGNVAFALRNCLKKRPCTVLTNDLRLRVAPGGLYTYPDLVVVCGDPRFADDQADTLLNPLLIVEVLSPSTEAFDRGRKFEHYRSLESLSEYLLVAQDRMHADLYTRQPDGSWVLREAGQADDTLELRSIDCHISMADLYSRLTLLSTPNARS